MAGNIIDSLLISIGVDPSKAEAGLQKLSTTAQKTDAEFQGLAKKWTGVVSGLMTTVIAPIAGSFAIGKVINSYMSDISQVATMTGAYSQKLEEWRIKRAMLSRVTKEDIELYRKGREGIVNFRIAMGDLSANIMRSAMPVMKFLLDGLNKVTKWVSSNTGNITRALTVTAGVLTAVFLPSILKVGAALLASPLTWIVATLGALVLVIDDLVTYMQGGKSALGDFWALFGTGEELTAKVTAALNILKTVFTLLAKPIAAVAAGFAAFKIGATIFKGVTTAVMGLNTAFKALMANPIVLIITAIVGVLMWLSSALDRAGGDWTKVWDIMKQDVVDFLNQFGGLGDWLSEHLGGVIEVIDAIATTIGGAVGTVIRALQLIWAYLTGAPDEVKDKLADGLKNAFTTFISGLGDWVIALGKFFFNAFKGLAGLGLQFGQWLLDKIGEGLSNLGGWIWDKISSAGGAIKDSVAGLWNSVSGAASNAFDSVSSTLGGLVDQAKGAGRDIRGYLSGTWSNIKDKAAGGIDSIKGFLSGLYDKMPSGMQKAATGMANAFKAGKALINHDTDTLKAVFGDMAPTVQAAFDAVTKPITDTYNKVCNWAKDLKDQAIGYLQELANFLSDLFDFDKWMGKAKGLVDSAKNKLTEGVKSVGSWFGFGGDEEEKKAPAQATGNQDNTAAVTTAPQPTAETAAQSPQPQPQGPTQPAAPAPPLQDPVQAQAATSVPPAANQPNPDILKGMGQLTVEKVQGMTPEEVAAERAKLEQRRQAILAKIEAAQARADELQTSMANLKAEREQAPVTANTNNIVNNTAYQDAHNQDNSQRSNVMNVTINAPGGDPRAISREFTRTMAAQPMFTGNYVTAADSGNWNT